FSAAVGHAPRPLHSLPTRRSSDLHGIVHRVLEPEAARGIEPALSAQPRLHAVLHLPDAETANCALLTKHLKTIAQDLGVQFRFKDRKSTRLNSSHVKISYAVLCLK